MEARELRRMSFEEYRALEASSDERWSYVNGEAWAMAGASVEHNLVARNVLFALMKALEGRTCRALSEGQKIATPRTRAFHYADASVVCGPMLRDTTDDHAITNPVVIVEVLSPTTADYDRGGKFAHYRTIASFREYVVVDVDGRRVEHHARLETGQWLMTELSSGTLELAAIEVAIPLAELWIDLDHAVIGTAVTGV
jgi:Uma2 family endonuclease